MTELPVTAWYMDIAAKGKSIWRDCPADLKQDLLFFLDHGYVVLKQSVPSDVISRARAEFEAHKTFYSADYEKHKDANGFQRRLVNWHCLLDGFKDLFAKNSRALALQDYIFRRPAVCYTSLTFESGSEQDIHRDTPYFTTTPEYYYLGVWVAMEHVDDRNGALMVYDGGHLVPEPDRGEIVSRYYKPGEAIDPFDPRLWNDYQASVENECEARGLEKKTVSMEPGDTLIWHPHLPHGGSRIIDKTRSRLSLVNHTVPEGVPVSQMAVFFGQQSHPDPRDIAPNYAIHRGRKFFMHPTVEFAHQDPHEVSKFRLSEVEAAE